MNSKLVSLLTSVCIVLILIIMGEWFYAVRVQKQTLASTTSPDAKILHDEMPGIELTRQSEESYVDLVARPLFIKGRKPVDEPTPEEAQAANIANTFDWELNGVYSTKKGLSALFSRSKSKVPKDNFRKVSTGADLDGWKLKEIHKDRAILSQGNQDKELLLRKPKAKELPEAAKRSRIPNAPNMPNIPNSPQPSEGTPDIPQPAEGEFENNNEQY